MIKENNKGVSIVELLVTIAISVIIVSAVVAFMNAGTSSYKDSRINVNLQAETQIIMNNITEKVMTLSDGVYNDTEKSLLLTGTDDAGNPISTKYWFCESKANFKNKIYMFSTNQDVATVTDAVLNSSYLGDYVKDFKCEIKDLGRYKVVVVKLTLETNNKTIVTEATIRFRN